jgi:hypothetical protein
MFALPALLTAFTSTANGQSVPTQTCENLADVSFPNGLVPETRTFITATVPTYNLNAVGDEVVNSVEMFFDGKSVGKADVDSASPAASFWIRANAGDAPVVVSVVVYGLEGENYDMPFTCLSDQDTLKVRKPSKPGTYIYEGNLYLGDWCYLLGPKVDLQMQVGGINRQFNACGARRPSFRQAGAFVAEPRLDENDEWSQYGTPKWKLVPKGTSPAVETVPVLVRHKDLILFRGEWTIKRNYTPAQRIWQGTDEFYNYCLKQSKETTMSGGQLYCTRPGTLSYKTSLKRTRSS